MKSLQSRVRALLESARDIHVFPGCAAGVLTPHTKDVITCGTFTYEPDAQEVHRSSIFDIASLTKAIPVSCSALKLIEQGTLNLNDQLISYVPSFQGSYREEITIHHLLTHTLDFDLRLSHYKDCSPDQLLEQILTVKLKSPPGVRFCYANATSILLGLVLEQCTGKSVDRLGAELFFEPLGMTRSGFDTSRFAIDEIVPSEIDPWRGGIVRGEVHDESAWKLQPRAVGSAGLFSTVDDILLFMDHLLKSFSGDSGALFTSEIIQMIITNQLLKTCGECTGLGWELNQKSFMGKCTTPSMFGKTGFTGCSIVADPVSNRAAVILSNHIFPKRRSDRIAINAVRRAFAEIVFKD